MRLRVLLLLLIAIVISAVCALVILFSLQECARGINANRSKREQKNL